MSTPPADDDESLPLWLQRLVTAACERYEAEWRGEARPEIEAFLEGLAPDERGHVLRELRALDASLRDEGGGDPPDRDDLGPAGGDANEVTTAPGRAHQGAPPEAGGSTPVRPDGGTPRPDAPGAGGVSPPGAPGRDESPPLPERFGRYRVVRALGRGSFGEVYQAVDDELGRPVAIKVPTALARASPSRVATILEEARHAAALRHPAIVAVYDVGCDERGAPFVVLEYVEGSTLADLYRTARPGPRRLAEILARVAEAVHHAHTGGLVHRDLKPSNILIDDRGQPRVADFGLAIAEEDQRGRTGEVAGTPPYMAPEQVRGETHRLDGRTDVWALGVILYQGMTGRLPFRARARDDVFDEILHRDPRPPRQVDDSLPRELERIGLKCLSRRMNDRYQTAGDLAEDLVTWVATSGLPSTVAATLDGGPAAGASTTQAPTLAAGSAATRPAVIPKGLRPFDGGDADFFLDLLPGPRGRDGLPESIRFWKSRIESRDPERAFPVGLLYGPSGCGKSSLVRAGLLERLDPSVTRIYLEAVPGETESILAGALGRQFPGASDRADLPGLVAGLRGGGGGLPPGDKVLIVLDQFEQWLHAHPADPDCDLVRALRQCDGERVQALLLVRDDFWMAVTRFFQALEVRLAEGKNSAAVELFDARHARRVLLAFGRAYGRVAEGDEGDGPPLGPFLDRAVAELGGDDGRVIPVRLCLLAEMLRQRPWAPATLRDLGGFEGIGVTFLEETFGASAPPTHRLHAPAAQAVLKALLPEPSSDLKGKVLAARGLRAASGYADRPADFDALMDILDTELRLVTPSDPELAPPVADAGGVRGEAGYQLTHDYLVPSLRAWLTRRQRETRRGRAELRLAAVTALWRDKPEPRRLPSLTEWLGILGNTRPRDWDADERRMMRAATRHHLSRLAAGLALASALLVSAWLFDRNRRAEALLAQAHRASASDLAQLVPELDASIGLLRRRLERAEAAPRATDRRRQRQREREREVATILLYRQGPTPGRASSLRERLARADAEQVAVLRDALATHPDDAGTGAIRAIVSDEGAAGASRLRMACALAALDPARADLGPAAPAVAEALLQEDFRSLPRWAELLGPAAPSLVPALGRICRDAGRQPTTRATAAEILAEILGRQGDAAGLARWAVDSLPDASRIIRRALEPLGPRPPALDYLRGVLAEAAADPRDELLKDELARRQAGAAVALAALGDAGVVWPRLRHHDDPRLRSLLIQRLAGAGLPPATLANRLALPDLDPIERQALLMVWAESDRAAIPAPDLAALTRTALRLYETDPHPAVHSAAELLLRRWKPAGFSALGAGPPGPPAGDPDGLRWEAGPRGHTFVILPAPPAFRMGSPEHEAGREPEETLHYRRIDRSIAVATKEVSLAQFRDFRREHVHGPHHGDQPDYPAGHIDWYSATAYCNWLSKEAGIEPAQWCYPAKIEPGAVIEADALERPGYRLPTEAEWEYACRALTLTSRPFGESEELLPKYACTWLNSADRFMPVGSLLPNEFGLFDVLGNVWEWCHDGRRDVNAPKYPEYPPGTRARPAPDPGPGAFTLRADTWRFLRGGAFDYSPAYARSARRYTISVPLTDSYQGFRVVRTLPPRHR